MSAKHVTLSDAAIRNLFALLDEELGASGTRAERHLVGGAVMCLAFNARESTRDVDALFQPASAVRRAADRVAIRAGVPNGWLNDAVKGYLGGRGEFVPFLELPNLKVLVASPEYLLALKCAAMRLGEEFRDLDDVRFLLRYLNLTSSREALDIVARYLGEAAIPVKTRLALGELLDATGRG